MQEELFGGEVSARKAAAAGMETAVRNANLRSTDWSSRARAYLTDYAGANAQFTAEEVREWAHYRAVPPLEVPPTMWAWGGVFQAAQRAETITSIGTAKATRQHVKHITLWRSNITGAALPASAPDPDRVVFHLATGEGRVACGAHRRTRSAAARAALVPAESKRGVTCLGCKGTNAYEKAK